MSPITDGTVVWRMRDSRCRYTVGELVAKVGPLNDYDHLLLCDGSTISATDYPDLVAALGGTQLPNLMGRVLEGDSVGGNYISAGLPNLTGRILDTFMCGTLGQAVGEGVYQIIEHDRSTYDSGSAKLRYLEMRFNASASNPIYGASETVQPPAYTTRIYICYAG